MIIIPKIDGCSNLLFISTESSILLPPKCMSVPLFSPIFLLHIHTYKHNGRKSTKANLISLIQQNYEQFQFSSSDTHPTSGFRASYGLGLTRSSGFSLLSFSNIFTLKSLPDSTLSSTGSSSSLIFSHRSIYPDLGRVTRVGVEGRLEHPDRVKIDPGDPNPEDPTCKAQELGMDFTLFSCNWRKDANISLIELEPKDRLSEFAIGDIGGDSVGEQDPSKHSLRGDPS